MTPEGLAIGFCAVTTATHLLSVGLAGFRCRKRSSAPPSPAHAPPVTIIRPVCGIDACAEETLGSTFGLDCPDFEIIFCVAQETDPAVPLVRRLIAAHPAIPARLLVGDDRISPNPKLNNVAKGWAAARTDWIVIADSNVLMPPDYVQQMYGRWGATTGLVCSPPVGSCPGNFWAELECAFLNTFQARYQYAGEAVGRGFAQGKSMLFRRDIIEAGGGIGALAAELAEDAATTKLIRAAGLEVHLVDRPFDQPLGRRSLHAVWKRQLRWARLRRVTFPAHFVPELIIGAAFPAVALAYAAETLGLSVAWSVGTLLALWFGAEAMLARIAGWHFSWRMPLALLLRDLALPVLWIDAWLFDDFTWRGNDMRLHQRHEAAADPSKG